MKLPHKFVAIDLETTDSDPEKGDIIQIGAVIINEDFTTGPAFSIYIKPLSTHRNPQAMEVNGITDEMLENAQFPEDAIRAFEKFAMVERRPVLASWGAYFDIPFLKTYYGKIEHKFPFSYKSLDLKSIAVWEMAKRDEDASGGLSAFVERLDMKFEGNPHEALADIYNAVRVVKKLMA